MKSMAASRRRTQSASILWSGFGMTGCTPSGDGFRASRRNGCVMGHGCAGNLARLDPHDAEDPAGCGGAPQRPVEGGVELGLGQGGSGLLALSARLAVVAAPRRVAR